MLQHVFVSSCLLSPRILEKSLTLSFFPDAPKPEHFFLLPPFNLLASAGLTLVAEGLFGCFCWASQGLCWIFSPACWGPSEQPYSCLVISVNLLRVHTLPSSGSAELVLNCVGPSIDPCRTTLGLCMITALQSWQSSWFSARVTSHSQAVCLPMHWMQLHKFSRQGWATFNSEWCRRAEEGTSSEEVSLVLSKG